MVSLEKEVPTLTNTEIAVLEGVRKAKVRRIEKDIAIRTRLTTVIQDCLARKPISLSYEEVYRQCAAVTNVISNRKEQAKDFTVKYVTVLMGFMDLHDQYRQKIENWQRKVVDYEVELEELRTQLQKRNLNKHVPEVALKLACLMKTDSNENRQPFLQILSDLICNKEKETKRWSDETKSLFAVILNYGGPALAKIIKDRLGGPHLSTIYRTATSSYIISSDLTDSSFAMARIFYDKIGYSGPFILAIDATTVVATLRVKGNRIIGFATENEVSVSTAQDIIDIVNSAPYEKAKLANAFVLAPIVEHVPSFTLCISPVVKGQDYLSVKQWMTKACESGSAHNIEVLGIGADGDSKFRKHYFQEHKRNFARRENQITIDYKGFDFAADMSWMVNGRACKTLMFPDWRHILKKWRNQLLNVKRILLMGKHVAQIEHLMKMYPEFKLECPLWKSDVYVRDKQNVDAATRVLHPDVRFSLKAWDEKASIATRVFLKLGDSIHTAFTKRELSVRERAKCAWLPITFLRLWKAWLKIEEYPVENYFITGQTHDDVILAGHSIIISMKLFAVHYPTLPYEPWMFGSDSCEVLFSSLRGFCRGNPNLTLMDMMDFARRIQKLKELNQRPFCELVDNRWPSDIDHELILGLHDAEKEAIKTAELLGMIESLEKGHVLTRTSDGDIAMLNPDTDVYPVNSVDTPDETNILEMEDLLNIENDLLLNTIDENQNEVSTALINVAVSARQHSAADEVENGNDDEEDDDDDSPSNCFFYKSGKCRYRDGTFKAPKKTEWLGCEFPGCKKWFHQVCLGLKFTTQQEKESYTYYCKDHPTTYYSSENKVVTSKCDKNMLETDSPTISKRGRVLSDNNNSGQDFRTTNPSYIEYNGTYYHISEFLSLQQGKVYMPSTSRNARWMAVSKANYYDNIDKIAASPNEEHMHCNSYAAFWMGDQGLVIGKVVRMHCSPTTKSAYPILQWKKGDPKSNVVTCCVNVAPIDVQSVTWSLQLKNRFIFCPMKALLVQLRVIDGEHGLEVSTMMWQRLEACYHNFTKQKKKERKRR